MDSQNCLWGHDFFFKIPTNFLFEDSNKVFSCRHFSRPMTLTEVDRSILVAFSSEELNPHEFSKSSMRHKIQQQDQYVSVRRPYIHVSSSGISDHIQRMMSSSSWLWAAIDFAKEWGWLTWMVTTTFIEEPWYASNSINMSVGEDCICLGGREQLFEGDLSNDYSLMDSELHIFSQCSLGLWLLLHWLSDVVAVKYYTCIIIWIQNICYLRDKLLSSLTLWLKKSRHEENPQL